MNQQELAAQARVSPQAVSALERGQRLRPRHDTVAMLADALGLSGPERQAFVAAGRRGTSRDGTSRDEAETGAGALGPSTALVGRHEEVMAARSMLLRSESRLLTLTGPPGVGKTRLATAVAGTMAHDFPDGVSIVSLGPLAEPSLVASTIRQTLGIRDTPGQSVAAQLSARIGDQAMLLVLDNFEHLLPAAPLLSDLLIGCPRLRILVTSRSALWLRDEQEMLVEPLPMHDAVTLFARWARARSAAFVMDAGNEAVVTDICRRLDCLPLALELAAAWVRILEPAALLERLEHRLELLVDGPRDLPERQRALRDALAWSYGLLEPDEQRVLRMHSVFAGGATLESVGAVCRVGPPDRTLRLVAGLVDKNLLRRDRADDEPRIEMLATIREYCRERLEAAGAAAAAERAHAEHFVALAETAAAHLMGPELGAWLARLDGELDNLRAALTWAQREGEAEPALRLAARLGRFWEHRGHLREGLAWLEAGLAMTGEVRPETRALALHVLGRLAWRLGDLATARARSEAAVELHRKVGDRHGVASGIDTLAAISWRQGEVAAAVDLCQTSLALRREVGDRRGVAQSLSNLATLLCQGGDGGRALAHLDEARAIQEELGDTGDLAVTLNTLAIAAWSVGRLDEARDWSQRSIDLSRGLGEVFSLPTALHTRGVIALAQGDLDGAAGHYRESLRIRMRESSAASLANSIQGLAAVARRRGQAARAAMLYAAADHLGATAPSRGWEGLDAGQIRGALREALGEESFQAAWAAGRELPAADAARLALDGDLPSADGSG